MCKLIDIIKFLLQSSFKNLIEFYHNWTVILCIMYDVRSFHSFINPVDQDTLI
jgi:hypothetical protein